MNSSKYINISKSANGLLKVIFNRPEKRNALNDIMVTSITSILHEGSKDPTIKVIVFTGIGSYFTSGNDLTNFLKANTEEPTTDITDLLHKGKKLFQEFVDAFIDCTKILVAIVNGPAVGVGVTMLAHFDLVFASKSATFHCPFTKLGQTPEGCSSLLFPLLMGFSKATQMLILGKKIDASEAFSANLVTKVVDEEAFESCWDEIDEICKLPPNTLLNAKSVLRNRIRNVLHKVNEEECKALVVQWSSEEFFESLMTFFISKGKL